MMSLCNFTKFLLSLTQPASPQSMVYKPDKPFQSQPLPSQHPLCHRQAKSHGSSLRCSTSPAPFCTGTQEMDMTSYSCNTSFWFRHPKKPKCHWSTRKMSTVATPSMCDQKPSFHVYSLALPLAWVGDFETSFRLFSRLLARLFRTGPTIWSTSAAPSISPTSTSFSKDSEGDFPRCLCLRFLLSRFSSLCSRPLRCFLLLRWRRSSLSLPPSPSLLSSSSSSSFSVSSSRLQFKHSYR